MSRRSGVFIPVTRNKKNETKKNQMHFDPVVVLNHFVVPGVAEPSTIGERMHMEEEVSTRYRISGVKVGFYIVKKRDLLFLKRMKFSKYHKGRCIRGCKLDETKLGFGRYGTQSCRVGRLSYRAIEAARQAIIGHFHRAMSGQFRKN
ncbi:hypothetical protein RYX36_021470, partial [Vicia faba]